MAMAIPFVMAAGSLIQGANQSTADATNASTMASEGRIAATQGYAAEAQQRRRTAMVIGSETAGAGQAGAGYGGSVGRAISQSSVNAEQDALSIRYKSQLQKWGYDTQATNLNEEGRTAMSSGLLRAGASLLKGYSKGYAGTDLG